MILTYYLAKDSYMEKNYSTRPLWFWNDKPTKESIRKLMENCSDKDGYSGFGILPYKACKLEYLGQEYMDLYSFVLSEAKRLNLKMCLYDEWWFPSGSAGGILKDRYPDACAKRLDMEEFKSDNAEFILTLPKDGQIMAVVGYSKKGIIDLNEFVKNSKLNWKAPDRSFRVLCFILRNSDLGRVDYLDPESVSKFIECTHEKYYERFSEYFGNVIDSSFYDEPQFYSLKGRAWTARFNEKFFEKYKESPSTYYPALFFDIGDTTARARHMMLSVRADLYSQGYPKVIQDWCTSHSISLTGHVDQEEAKNPCGITGDLMLSFKHQEIPGVDEIFHEGRASTAYKLVSSSAVNWNKQLVMCECFGAIDGITEQGIYRESYDLFTKGINMLVPHAVWLNEDNDKVKFKPELSYRNEYYGKILPKFNRFCSTVQSRLQTGGQVNSVAVLYPIDSLQYVYSFSWKGDPVKGGKSYKNNNYMKLGQFLIRNLNCDFAFLHPETLSDQCVTNKGVLSIPNSIHYQDYKVLIMPGMKAMSISSAKKIKEFVRTGGTLISVSELPAMETEQAANNDLREIIRDLFGSEEVGSKMTINKYGSGKCISLPYSELQDIGSILDYANMDTVVVNKTYGLQYIHKRTDKKDIWFFASIFKNTDSDIVIDGSFNLKSIDPFSGEEKDLKSKLKNNSTVFHLKLGKEQSILIEGTIR